jgi:hypothetical protein
MIEKLKPAHAGRVTPLIARGWPGENKNKQNQTFVDLAAALICRSIKEKLN